MRILVRVLASFVAVAAVSALAGCNGIGCSAHAESPIGAVTGMLSVLPEADDPGDICQYVSEGWVVSQDEFEALKSELSPLQSQDVHFVEGEQMAGDITVDAVVDGVVEYTFNLTAVDDTATHWTLDLGDLVE